jgi:hypothetical protein
MATDLHRGLTGSNASQWWRCPGRRPSCNSPQVPRRRARTGPPPPAGAVQYHPAARAGPGRRADGLARSWPCTRPDRRTARLHRRRVHPRVQQATGHSGYTIRQAAPTTPQAPWPRASWTRPAGRGATPPHPDAASTTAANARPPRLGQRPHPGRRPQPSPWRQARALDPHRRDYETLRTGLQTLFRDLVTQGLVKVAGRCLA